MRQCPQCKSEAIHRSRTRSRWEAWLKGITGKRPYRCHVCGWRGWGADYRRQYDESEVPATGDLVQDPPKLKGTAPARFDQDSHEVDLKELDTPRPIPQKRQKPS